MRHSKSSHENKSLKDFDRPLNSRGERDAPLMGKIIYQKGIVFQEVISSPAERAIQTARLFCEQIAYPFYNIKEDYNLYASSTTELLFLIKNLSETSDNILLVGHNPSLTDLSNYLSNFSIDNIPTSGIVELSYLRKSWMEVEMGSFKKGFFEFPKKYFTDETSD